MMAHPVSGSNLCILLTIAWHSRVRPPKTCPARHCLNWIHHVPVISSYHRYSSDRRALLILCRNIRVQYFNSQSQINHIVFFEGYSAVWCFYFLQVQLFTFNKIIFKVFYNSLGYLYSFLSSGKINEEVEDRKLGSPRFTRR